MNERTIKRLLVTLAVAIAIIMLAKFMLTRTVISLNQAAEYKKQSARQHAAQAAVSAPADSLPAVLGASAAEAAPVSTVEDNTR